MNDHATVLGAALFLFVAPLLAESSGPDYWTLRTAPSAGSTVLRSQPSPSGAVVMAIPAGARCLKNLGCRGGLTFEEFISLPEAEKERLVSERPRWCKVGFQGETGWIPARYLQEASTVCEEPLRSDEDSGVEPVHVEGYRMDSGAGRPGGDYSRAFAADVQACARRCSGEERCRAFDFFYKERLCVLKEQVPAVRRNPEAISGVKERP